MGGAVGSAAETGAGGGGGTTGGETAYGWHPVGDGDV